MTIDEQYKNRIQSFGWSDLHKLWEQIQQRNTPNWQPGKALEYLILRAFQLDDADVKFPYPVLLLETEVEQIDGVVYYSGLSCLVESKDFADSNVDSTPVSKLRNQLLRRPTGTVGLVFSRTGFTDSARYLSFFSLPQSILLWSGEEIEYVLHEEKICEFLIVKYRACVEYGLTDYDIREIDIP